MKEAVTRAGVTAAGEAAGAAERREGGGSAAARGLPHLSGSKW